MVDKQRDFQSKGPARKPYLFYKKNPNQPGSEVGGSRERNMCYFEA